MNAPLPHHLHTHRPARQTRALPSPQALRERLPLSCVADRQIQSQRQAIRDVLAGHDPRLLVIVGPCSLHDSDAALEYGEHLASLAEETRGQLLLVMRSYLEKPRTSIGWKGMLYDPHLDGSSDLACGLQQSRRLLLQLIDLGLPLANELLQPLAAGYLDDLLGWAAIGARTSESQIHREMVSGLEMPVGFKNGTDGSLSIALDAMRAAAHPHSLLGLDGQGRAALVQTRGNQDTHLVLRGGASGPNHDAQSIRRALEQLEAARQSQALMVDCSHANSGKNPKRQPDVLREVLRQRQEGVRQLRGVMLESHLHEGNQPLGAALHYGVSITDACLGWEDTRRTLLDAATALA